MSFVYAEKTNILFENIPIITTQIFSDTKITMTDSMKSNWSTPQIANIEKFGFIKSMIICPTCCISFAGNELLYVTKLFDEIFNIGTLTEEQLIELAYNTHMSAKKDDIEFIICYADDENKTHIVCIKERHCYRDCQFAWIGSCATFDEMQRKRKMLNEKTSTDAIFQSAIDSGVDEFVGGFDISASYMEQENRFVYDNRMITHYPKEQLVLPGENVKIFCGSDEGGYTISYQETPDGLLIQLEQSDLTVLYSNKYRLTEEDIKNKNIKYFMLPMRIHRDTGRIIG